MEICISSGSIWFRVSYAALAVYFVTTLFLFSWGFRLRLLRSFLPKSKKRALYNSILDDSRPLLNKHDNKAYNDVLAEKTLQVQWDTKDSNAHLVRVFTYQSLVAATQNFTIVRRMCNDGFGQVFIGQLIDTSEVVVIRRLDQYTHQSLQGFLDEALLLSQASHPNLAKLLGYCAEQHNRLLVYQYVPGICLKERLHGDLTCLDWNTRMKIVLGIARAVEYLHNTMKPPILHCFIQPSDIWLDGECTPKLFSFGVIRMYPSRSGVNCPYDMVRGYAYGLHDYHLTDKLTLQTDIHGFGMFLLEMITGKKGAFSLKDGSRQQLAQWVKPYLEDKQKMAEIVDPRLEERFDKRGLQKACKLAKACLNVDHNSRPLISNVVKRIEDLVRGVSQK